MSGLSYEGMVSLRWQPLDALPAGDDLLQLAGDNERLLQLLPGLESMPESAHDEEAPPRYMQLLELRLQLLTELLAELLAQSQPPPPSHRVTLSAESISWEDEAPPPPGTALMLELFLHRHLPRPLRLPAVVERIEPAAAGQRVLARLQRLPEAAAAELDKLIFRQHRRRIASLRKGSGSRDHGSK